MEIIFGEAGDDGVFVDFDNNKSLLVTGAHSVGKSTLMHFILSGLFAKAEKENLGFTLIDANRVEFGVYRNNRFVEKIITRRDDFIQFLESFVLGKQKYDKQHFIIIDDLDFFDLKEFDNNTADLLFGFIQTANLSSNIRLIVGSSYIENSRIYNELTSYFVSKIFFVFQSLNDLKRLTGMNDTPTLQLYEYIGFLNKEIYYPVRFRNMDEKEIFKTTTRFSIAKFKEYMERRRLEIDGAPRNE